MKIRVLISDCDGYTSAAALMNYLNMAFPYYTAHHVSYAMHKGKQHGINLGYVPKGAKLVIIPDAGSNQYEEHRILKEQGIDVLVIDHHIAEKVSEYACVINNQLCDYPTKSLSGVGMVYKFCSYIDSLMGQHFAEELADLVALGLVADMVDIRDLETRYLITKGIQNIKNPFIKAMTEKQEYSISKAGGLCPFSIAFYIAPLVNAVTRTGTQEDKELLFKSMLDAYAYKKVSSTKRGCKGQEETMVEQAVRMCGNVKNHQTKIQDECVALIEDIIQEEHLLDNKLLIVPLDKETAMDSNLTGLIANKLMAKYQRPVAILNERISPEGKITYEGSGRGYDKSKLKDFRGFVRNSNLALYAEGHESAFGLGFTQENLPQFIQYSNEVLKNFDFSPCYLVDFIYNENFIDCEEILDIARWYDLWGQKMDEPLICLRRIKVNKDNVDLMAKGTLKITINNDLTVIKFGSNEEEYASLCPEIGYQIIDIVGKCSFNNYTDKAQIKLIDYEIVDSMRYYF